MCSSRPSRASPGGSACKTTRRNALASLRVRRRGKVTLVFTRSHLWCALASDAPTLRKYPAPDTRVSVVVSGTSEPSGGKETARRPRGAAASRWLSVSVTTRTAVAHLVEEHPVDVLLGDDADRAFRRGVNHDHAPYFFVHQGSHDARQLVFGHGGHALRGGHHETRHRRHVFSPRE